MIDLNSHEHCILILAPIGMDATLCASILERAGIQSVVCQTVEGLIQKLSEPCGAILLTEEALDQRAIELLNEAFRKQPPWSDIPLVLLTTGGESTAAQLQTWNTFASVGNVTLLERPVKTSTLVASLQVALRSRRRQYQVRQLLEEQRTATQFRDELISIASHELKTPITSLKLQAQIMQRSLDRLDGDVTSDEQIRKLVKQTKGQIDRIGRLVEEMLDVSRIHVGKFSIRRESFDLADLLKETLERFSPQLSAVGCNAFLTAEPCVGRWDRYRLEQVISNLITNSIRYAPGAPIRISLQKEGARVRFCFEDEGPGIPKGNVEKIFQRFERATSSHGISGLGLGLYICRQIIEAHGGTIRADPTHNKGARFVVDLPLGDSAAEVQRTSPI